MKKKLQMVGFCLATVVCFGYFLAHLVPGSPDFSDVLSAIVGLAALFAAIRCDEELDQEEFDRNHRVDVREIFLRPLPVSFMKLEIDTPTFVRRGLGAKVRRRKVLSQEEAPVVQAVTATVTGGRH